jgi:hypothetical protein
MKVRWLLVPLLVLVVAACSDFFTFSGTKRVLNLRGTVTDASSGAPMEGVFVSLEWTLYDTIPGGAFRHTDTETAADGTYAIDQKMGEVNCATLFLLFANPGYDVTRVRPDCRDGRQTLDVELRPDPSRP